MEQGILNLNKLYGLQSMLICNESQKHVSLHKQNYSEEIYKN